MRTFAINYYLCEVNIIVVIVVFEKLYLQELYELGRAKGKKHRFQPEIILRYKRCIDLMIHVPDLIALNKYRSLNLEKLVGDKAGIYSIRVDRQYRIEFVVTKSQGEIKTTICNIIDLSNHYK